MADPIINPGGKFSESGTEWISTPPTDEIQFNSDSDTMSGREIEYDLIDDYDSEENGFFSSTKNKLKALGLTLIVISAIVLLYPEEEEFYTISYNVELFSSEEVLLSHSYISPYSSIEIGGMTNKVDDCWDVIYCENEMFFEFEYKDSFSAKYSLIVIGGEEAEEISACISIRLEGKTIANSCNLYYDQNDDYNLGVIVLEYSVGNEDIESLTV